MIVWLNGEFIENDSAVLPANAAGALLGCGVFTTVGVWGGRAFALERHLQRLRRDAAKTRIPSGFDEATIGDAVHRVLKNNGITRGMVRLTLLQRGDGRWSTEAGGDLLILARPLPETASENARLVLSPFRVEARRALCGVKSTSYLEYQLAWQDAARDGFDEAILCNSRGVLCECTRSNIFWVHDGVLRTPSMETGCLPGIARELILEWATDEIIPAQHGFYTPHELASADEVFITSAAQGPRAVASFSLNAEDTQPIRYDTNGRFNNLFAARWRHEVNEV